MWEIDPDRLASAMTRANLNQSQLADLVGVKQPSIGRLLSGETKTTRALDLIARALGTTPAFLKGEADDPSQPDPQPLAPVLKRSDDRVIEIPVIDLAYGMGGTFLDDVEPEARSEPFPLSFIRRYTKAKAEDLFVADGLGDSMAPTIGSNDQMLIDRSIDSIRVADQIWAFSFGGVGMVKRLRPRPDGSVAILSDNPAVSEDRAVDDELFIIGRVVAIVRKV